MQKSSIAHFFRRLSMRRFRSLAVPLGALMFVAACWAGQAHKPKTTPKHAPLPTASATLKASANVLQLMRGIMFPNSNLIYAAQGKDPAEWPAAKRPSTAINPLEGTYGKWEAVENSSLIIAETANLLTIPGRSCSNGLPAPVTDAEWLKFVQGLRDAGMQSYEAAKSKNSDKILDASDAVTTACGNCHVRYRDKPTLAERCR